MANREKVSLKKTKKYTGTQILEKIYLFNRKNENEKTISNPYNIIGCFNKRVQERRIPGKGGFMPGRGIDNPGG